MRDNKNEPTAKSIASRISPRKMIYPILIGLGFVGYMIYNNFDVKAFDVVKFTWNSFFWIMVAILFMAFRDLGYVMRLRILTNNDFGWKQALRVIMLWEFTSAITPSAVGGTGLAIIYVNKEGIGIGRSSAIVMATSFLDELYFIIMFPLLILFLNPGKLFFVEDGLSFANEFFYFAVIGYSIKLAYIIVLSYGLFKNPRGLKKLLVGIFKLRFIRKWRYGAAIAGTEIIESSKELKTKPFSFWLKAFIATAFSWTSRYWVVNALFLAFFIVDDHVLLFARQLVMWIMMLISPTPGGSGFTEFVFTEYLGDFLPAIAGISIVMATLWRLITYYPYLVIGSIIVPPWVKKNFVPKEKDSE
ncbi:MAG: lysylphosphatidylglycerol synthase transmembrane domain-containing protein [Bacteroidales bacterium]|nr:lysylphosphatidylglycerol synthase transmembrane domain-containing protein [Bacteroidales bacterium]